MKACHLILASAAMVLLAGCATTQQGTSASADPGASGAETVDLNLCVYIQHDAPKFAMNTRAFMDDEGGPFFQSVRKIPSLTKTRGCDLVVWLELAPPSSAGIVNMATVYPAYGDMREPLMVAEAKESVFFPFGAGPGKELRDKVYRAFKKGTHLYAQVVAERDASRRQEQAQEQAKAEAVQPQKAPGPPTPAPTITSDIDRPVFGAAERVMGDNDVAVVIGVEKYQDLPAADYAANDARLVKDYLVALGLKERNIQLLVDEKATQSSIKKTVETWLANRVKKESRVFVYYSGHGSPDPATGAAYIVPHDGDPNYLADTGYPLKNLYEKLGALPAQEVVVVLDACFSGAGGRSVLAKGARPMVVTKEGGVLPANLTVLAATQGAQISTSAAEKGHGLFTYHFLKALKQGKKDIVEIYQQIQPVVEDEAKALNVQQSPSLNPEPRLAQVRFRLRN